MTNNSRLFRGPVFKYRSLGTDGSSIREYAQRLIEDGEIYFALPSSFNDIYEGLPSLSKNLHFPFLSSKPVSFGKYALDFSGISFPMDNNYLIRRGFEEAILKYFDAKFGIFCASRTNRSIQQWAYYGDNHFGFCVEINPSMELIGYEMTYVDERPSYNLFDFVNKGVISESTELDVMLTKHSGWLHEQEVRFLHKPSSTLNIGKNISCIYLGMRTGEQEEELIRHWLSNSDHQDVPIKKMHPHENVYEVISKIDTASFSVNMGFPGDYHFNNES